MIKYLPYKNPSVYSKSSLSNLGSCKSDLRRLFTTLADDGWDITIICGHRGEAEQNKEYAEGDSHLQWPDSNHNTYLSNAVDIAPYIPGVGIPWKDDHPWHMLAGAVFAKAHELHIKIEWGGHWGSLEDLPHWQLAD